MGGDLWIEENFEDVIDFREGPGILAKDFVEFGVPLVRLTGLNTGGSILDGCNFLDPETVEKRWSHFQLERGDVLLSASASLGRTAVVEEAGVGAIPYTGIIRMRPKGKRMYAPYIRYLLSSPSFQQQAEMMGVGSVIRHFGPSHLRQMKVDVPPVSDQRAIAGILGTLDDKIELNRRMNETLEAMARALFKSWFVDFDPVRAKMEGRQTGLPEQLDVVFPDRLAATRHGEAPEGWHMYCLGEISEHHTKTVSPSLNGDAKYEHFSIPAHDSGQVPSIEYGASIKSNKTIVPAGAVLLSKLNPEIHRVWIPDQPMLGNQVCSTEFLAFTPAPPSNRSLLYSLFVDAGFRNILRSMVTGTSKSHQRVPPKALKTRQVLWGSAEAFAKFGSLVEPILARVLRSRAESETLTAIRDGLLPKLISGKLRAEAAGTKLAKALGDHFA